MAAPLLCLALLLASGAAAGAQALKDYPQVKFSTASATPEKYNTFIAAVRAALVSKAGGKSNGIPVLLDRDDPLALQTYLNITLTNSAGHSISLKMDVTGAYFTAYVAGKYSCLLKRSGRAFSSAICYSDDPWSSSAAIAAALQYSAGVGRGGGGGYPAAGRQDLGAAATWRAKDLDQAVSSLFLFPTGNATKEDVGRAVAACDMMIAGAAAFPYVQRRVSAGMRDGNGVPDDPSLHGLQARWPALSAAVQESFQGAFPAPVAVQRSNGKWLRVDNVRAAVPLVSFLEHDGCKSSSSSTAAAAADSQQQLPMVIRSVVEDAGMGGGAGAPACSQAEPTTRIVGPEGRCVDVPYNWYYRGNQVQLWPCKSNGDANQLWTFRRDGTVRSGGMCLAAAAAGAGARVVVDACPPRVPAARAVWEARADGTVALRASGLVLSVTSSSAFAGVTVRRDDRGTGQSWTPTNETAPLTAPVVGFGDRCLQADGAGAVSLAACGGGMAWSLYPDGSVRPPAWLFLQWRCLAADAGGRVAVRFCDGSGSACERWVFRSDGTVLNTGTGMVLDARPSAGKSGRYDVVVSPATGSATQQWALML